MVKPMKDGPMDFSTGTKDSKADTKEVKEVKEEKKDASKVKVRHPHLPSDGAIHC